MYVIEVEKLKDLISDLFLMLASLSTAQIFLKLQEVLEYEKHRENWSHGRP